MPSMQEWKPQGQNVQGALRDGNFVTSNFALICSGPPRLKQLADISGQVNLAKFQVYPIGLVQGFSIGQSRAQSKIFEIGSNMAYNISGRSTGQISMSRVLYHGPNLLRTLYAWYDTSTDTEGYAHEPLYDISGAPKPFGTPPFSLNSIAEPTVGPDLSLKSIKIPPGYDNFFMNLASDLFSQPFGLLVILLDNNEKGYAAFYIEGAVIPSHSFGFESQGLIISEQVGITYSQLQPIQLGQLRTVRDINGLGAGGFLSDVYGGYSGGGKNLG